MNRIALLLAAVLVAGCAIDQGKFSGLTDQSLMSDDHKCKLSPGTYAFGNVQ